MILWSSDVGYNFLVCFFLFWTVQIIIGIIIKLKNLGFTCENYRHRAQDLLHEYVNKLEEPYHRKHS
ncbi:hypothetical protein [Peredibacter starrii]|uniref:Uncharacterized protein n=1 Tax=Peredibacter starrii TaxID=28202 RepID=A0AAX4HUH3_9BACT|nr:hypothetical protein [Peredibacter starrii]WPU66792.1 hypothetical protein SOO65_08530 [Peredibacter starrii]